MPYPTGENPANLERQQLIPTYEANGIIYVTDRAYLAKSGNWINPDKSGYYIMSSEAYIDIDTKYDFILLEAVIEDYFKKGAVP